MSKIRKNKKKNYHALFDKYVQEQGNIMQVIANRFEERVRFFSSCKKFHLPGSAQRFEGDPNLHYFNQCQSDQELVLPLLQYVDKKTLCL